MPLPAVNLRTSFEQNELTISSFALYPGPEEV
jgi:hypothetical protein